MRLALVLMLAVVGIGDRGSGIRTFFLGVDVAEDNGPALTAVVEASTAHPALAIPGFRIPDPGSRLVSAAQRPLGSIRGRVDIRRDVLPPERRPDVAGLSMPAPRDQPDTRRAVVYLETAPARAFEDRSRERARMDQRNETFLPHVLAVEEGTVVDFPNNDSTYHNVFSLSKAKRFDLGRYARGRSRAVRFDRPGIVRVFCDIHSHMSAFVLVFSHPYYATTDADGRYRIDSVPPGTYTLTAWHEGSARDTRTVTIPPQGGPVDLDFVVQ